MVFEAMIIINYERMKNMSNIPATRPRGRLTAGKACVHPHVLGRAVRTVVVTERSSIGPQ